MTFRSFVRPLFVALTLAFATTATASAFADDAGAKAAEHAKGKGKGKAKGRKLNFPMEGDKFTKNVDGRIEKAKDKLTGALAKRGVGDAEKAKILKEFDAGAELVKAAAKKAAKDGTVTKEEAKEVRTLVKSLRKLVHDKLPKKAEKAGAKDV